MNNKASQQTRKTNVNNAMRVMDVYAAMKKQNLTVQDMLDEKGKKEELKQVLRATYRQMDPNTPVDETILDAAITSLLSHEYEFQAPPISPSTRLYINRGKIIRKFFLTPALALGLAMTGISTINSISNSIEARRERTVEQRIMKSYEAEQALEKRVNELTGSDIAKQLPSDKKVALLNEKSKVDTDLAIANTFFAKYCPLGKAEKAVTKDNYVQVERELPKVERELGRAEENLLAVSDIIQKQRGVSTTRQSLDKTFQDFRSSGAPVVLLNKSQVFYNQGIASLEQGDVNEARKAEGNISALSRDVAEITTLPKAIEQLHKSVKEIAVEKKAIELEGTIYADSKVALETGDIQRLRTDKYQLSDLVDVLSHEYKLRIVSQPKTYSDRYYTSNATGERTFMGHFAMVEAVENGRVIAIQIVDAEDNNRLKRVDRHGEEVVKYVKEEVKEDKKDGVVDNNYFGSKKKGYITQDIAFTSKTGKVFDGQIPDEKTVNEKVIKFNRKGKQIAPWKN